MPHIATSIVDFLRGRGLQPISGEKFPFFDLRKRLFSQAGLGGDFRGTAEQNVALLNRLQSAETNLGVNISPENINRVFVADAAPGLTAVSTGATGKEGDIFDVFAGTEKLELGDPRLEGVDIASLPPGTAPEGFVSKFKPVPSAPPPTGEQITEPPPSVGGTEAAVPTPETGIPSGLVDLAGQAGAGQLPTPEEVREQALTEVLEDPLFPLEKEASEAEKASIQFKAEADKKNLLQTLASKGIAQGGLAGQTVSRFEEGKLAKLLGVDRKFAKLIAQGIATATQNIVKQAQKEIDTDRTEARDALKELGFVVLPNGQVVQTPKAARAETKEARDEAAARRSEEAGVRAEQGLQLDVIAEERLQERLTLDKLKFQLSVQKEARVANNQKEPVDKDKEEFDDNINTILGNLASDKLSGLTRAEIISDIDANAVLYSRTIGIEGVQIMIEEVNRLWPPPPSQEEVVARQAAQSPVTAEQTGEFFGEGLKDVFRKDLARGVQAINRPFDVAFKAAGSFLKGIF